jgi:hypothetical protein
VGEVVACLAPPLTGREQVILRQRRGGALSFAKERAPHPPKKATLLGERARTPPFPQTPYPALSFSSRSGSDSGAGSVPTPPLGNKITLKKLVLDKVPHRYG